MAKEKKITFKYSIHKKKKPELNKEGTPIYQLYVRITYNRVSTKFSLPHILDYENIQGGFTFPKVEEGVVENLKSYWIYDDLKQYERLIKKIIQFEASKYSDSYSIINIKNRLKYYTKNIATEIADGNQDMILSKLEDVLSFKKYNEVQEFIFDDDEYINEGCFLILFLLSHMEKNFQLEIEGYLSDEDKIWLCISLRFQYFLSNIIKSDSINISDWVIGNLQNEFRLYLKDKKYLEDNGIFKNFDSHFCSIFNRFITMYELPVEKHIVLINNKLVNIDLDLN